MKELVTENDKVLIAKLILKITFIMIFISVGIKLLGFNLFDANIENKILVGISNIFKTDTFAILFFILKIISIYLQIFVILHLISENKNNVIYIKISIFITLLIVVSQYLLHVILFNQNSLIAVIFYYILSFILLFLGYILIDCNYIKRKKFLNIIKKPIKIILLFALYSLIISFLREITIKKSFTIIYQLLYNFDYIIILLITYYLHLKKVNNLTINEKLNINIVQFFVEFPDKNLFKNYIYKFSKFTIQFKKLSKIDKIVNVLYLIFFILQEIINISLVIFIANINNYLIECLFIITAFMISKKVFGAFHFKSFILCFLVSNITFFILSKISLSVELTYIIPITLGIIFSFIASKFIKTKEFLPYRGMSEDDLYNIIKNKKLTKLETNILVDYYSNRYNLTKLSIKYNYSERSIQRYKSKALKKLEL